MSVFPEKLTNYKYIFSKILQLTKFKDFDILTLDFKCIPEKCFEIQIVFRITFEKCDSYDFVFR